MSQVHPLLLLQGYSNLDKHRQIRMSVGRALITAGESLLGPRARPFHELRVGNVVSPDAQWGTPVPIETSAAVMVTRPDPWSAAVNPGTEAQHLRDWVRNSAVPRLITGFATGEGLATSHDQA